MALRWFVIHSMPRAEARVAALLAAEGQGWQVETYLPLLPAGSRQPTRRAPSPLFPGYLFLHCETDRLHLRELRRIPGFRSLLTVGDRLAVVEDETIAALRERVSALQAQGWSTENWFQRGEMLHVGSGPLAGLDAIFEGPLQPAERARVLVEFLGRTSRMTVPAASLERRSRPARRTRGHGRPIAPRP